MTETSKPNIYQRLQKIAGEVGTVAPTGSNQYKKKAISIEDTENALRDHLAKNGIITRWSHDPNRPMERIEGPAPWQVFLVVHVVNADDPTNCFEDYWSDIGTNPMAAASFARKGYYKALLHIAEDDDETDAPRQSRTRYTEQQIAEAREANPEASQRADRERERAQQEADASRQRSAAVTDLAEKRQERSGEATLEQLVEKLAQIKGTSEKAELERVQRMIRAESLYTGSDEIKQRGRTWLLTEIGKEERKTRGA